MIELIGLGICFGFTLFSAYTLHEYLLKLFKIPQSLVSAAAAMLLMPIGIFYAWVIELTPLAFSDLDFIRKDHFSLELAIGFAIILFPIYIGVLFLLKLFYFVRNMYFTTHPISPPTNHDSDKV